jgi:hypothetical protein
MLVFVSSPYRDQHCYIGMKLITRNAVGNPGGESSEEKEYLD